MVATSGFGWSDVRAAAADILVVGAGTTGLALALQAHDHGAAVRVVERREQPFRPSRALIVHPRTLEVLRPLGVSGALLAGGDPAPSVRLHLGGRELAADLGALPLADTAFPHLLFETQTTIERVLSEALADRGIEVERGCELVAVRRTSVGVSARLRRATGDHVVACRYLAGCDGAASAVRRAAAIGWRGAPYRQEVVLADVEIDGHLAAEAAHAVAARRGVVFFFPLAERATWRLLATRPVRHRVGTAGDAVGPVPPVELQGLIDGSGLAVHVTDIAWSAAVPLEHRLAASYRSGPLFVVGDAAHVHSPAGGQGMNTGIQDATNLGWKLAVAASSVEADGTAPEALLDSYEAERRPVARRVVAMTHLLFWAEAGTDPAASWLRSTLVPAVAPTVPFLLRRRRVVAAAAGRLSQLRIVYGRSPITFEGSPPCRHAARPGWRLPDELAVVEGHQRRLHEVLARPGIHLLLERDVDDALSETLRGHVSCHRVDTWPGRGVVGVRPDGYVGYRSGVTDLGQVRRWLSAVGADRLAVGRRYPALPT